MNQFVREPHSEKWAGNQDNFALTLMDMDLPLFPSFREAILNKISSANNFTYKYPSQQYYNSIIEWYRLRHIRDAKTQIHKDYIVESPSVLNTIYLMIQNQTKQGDNILVLSPIFFKYKQIVLHLKRNVIQSRLYNQKNGNISRYDINFSDLQQKATKCTLMIFCNPHNPTGRIYNQQEVNKIAHICRSNNLLLISDQILSDLVPQKLSQSFHSLVNLQYPRIVVSNSISKTFNSSSIRGGYAIIKNAQIRKKYLQTTEQLGLHLSQFAIYCVQIYYSAKGLQWLKYIQNLIQQNYNYLINKAKNTRLTISQLQAGYAIVIGFQGYIKFIQRWYRNQPDKTAQSRNIVSFFLAQHKIKANLIPYLSQPVDILTDVRFTIAVQKQYFMKFADKLISSLLETQQKHLQID